MKILIILFSMIFSTTIFCSCGQSDADIEMENKLKGYWMPTDSVGKVYTDIPLYYFGDSTKGASRWPTYSRIDTFAWEIRRKQLNIYYEDAIKGYFIGYDQYNSRSMLHIRNVTDTMIFVTQVYSNGYQTDFYFKRITGEDFLEELVETSK